MHLINLSIPLALNKNTNFSTHPKIPISPFLPIIEKYGFVLICDTVLECQKLIHILPQFHRHHIEVYAQFLPRSKLPHFSEKCPHSSEISPFPHHAFLETKWCGVHFGPDHYCGKLRITKN